MDTSNDNVVVLVEGHEQEEAAKNAAAPPEREYRRGNWTLPETMVLIEAKKWVHGERQRLSPENLVRWKRVEDYCWRAGCRRSQNQCNDRWDNLMRDYKKVRAYEHGSRNGGGSSYWEMGRAERKERGLPTNLLREIYEALGEAVEKKTSSSGDGVVFVGSSSSLVDVPLQASPLAQVLPRVLDYGSSDQEKHVPMHCFDWPERKRRRPSGDHQQPGSSTPSATRSDQEHHGDGRDGDGDDDDDDDDVGEHDLSSSISKCATILSEALQNSEAGEERRHREAMAVEERRRLARQLRREAGEQCMAGLATAMNRLANSILALRAATAVAKPDHKGPSAPK